jgi:hypothetical protein
MLPQTGKESFEGAFAEKIGQWPNFLKEHTVDKCRGKSYYAHKRLRSAYLSLKCNMLYFRTWLTLLRRLYPIAIIFWKGNLLV